MKVRTLLSTILITFCLNCIAQIKLNFNYSSYAKEVNRVYVVLKSPTNEIEILNDTVRKFEDTLDIPSKTENYILSLKFENKTIGKEEFKYTFSTHGNETDIEINLRTSKNNFDKKEKQSGNIEIVKYYEPKHNLEIQYLPKLKGDEFYKPPFFMLKNNSNDTIYGQYIKGYFWGSISILVDSIWTRDYFGRLDYNFAGGSPLFPDSMTVAWVGSFGWRSELPKNRYKYTLLYTTDKNSSSGLRKHLERDSFIWWADTKKYYRLIYQFEVK